MKAVSRTDPNLGGGRALGTADLGLWVEASLDTAEARARTLAICAQVSADDPRAQLASDPAWLLAGGLGQGESTVVYLCYLGAEVVGYAAFRVGPSRLPVTLFGVGLGGIGVGKMTLVGCPLFRSSALACESALIDGLLRVLARHLGARDAVFLLGLRADSQLFAMTAREGRRVPGFRVLPYGPTYQRRLIAMPDSYAEYLAGLGRKTREDLRRHHRKLFALPGRTVRVERFAAPEAVDRFVADACGLSAATYQTRQLGVGLQDSAQFRAALRFAAEQGWLIAYILYCDAEPIAFMLGYLRGGTYYSEHIGYHPDWYKQSAGNVLHLEVVRDLIESGADVRCFDFLYGDNSNKKNLANQSRTERNLYLIKASWRGIATHALLLGLNTLTETVGGYLESRGVKAKIRRALRRNALRRS
mgnify:CR=1 FL=1